MIVVENFELAYLYMMTGFAWCLLSAWRRWATVTRGFAQERELFILLRGNYYESGNDWHRAFLTSSYLTTS